MLDLQHAQFLILLFASLSKTTFAAPTVGFKICNPDKDGPSCIAAGKYGEICSDKKPCERGYYCKQRSPEMFICDSGVEPTHEKLKHLIAGCLDTKLKEPGLELTSYDVNKILNSYYLSDKEKLYLQDEKHLNKRSNIKTHKFCSIQEHAVEVCDGKETCVKPSRLEKINSAIIDDLISEQTKLPEPKDSMILYRTDKRSPSKLRDQGGLFVPDPISLQHARLVAPLAVSYSAENNLEAEFDRLGENAPYLVTSISGRAPRNDKTYNYLLKLPIPTSKQGNGDTKTRQLIYNGPTLNQSQIIGIRAGDHIAFLTGLSAEFVQSVDRNDGDGFLPINKAVKEDISSGRHKIQSKISFGFIQPPSPDSPRNDEND